MSRFVVRELGLTFSTPKTPLCSCQSSIGRKKHLSAVVKVRYHIPCLDDCLTDLVHRRAVWICHGGDWGGLEQRGTCVVRLDRDGFGCVRHHVMMFDIIA